VAPVGQTPEWRKDGREIVFNGPMGIMAVAVERSGSELRFGTPRSLFSDFRSPAGVNASDRPLAVSRDGSHIYYIEGVEQPDTDMIHIKLGALN
jgi:hypothetical protein